MNLKSRVTLIHATPVAVDPVCDEFKANWPEAFVTNLLDDSLSPDHQSTGYLDDAMIDRFIKLGRYAADTGSDALLFTCSAFGPAIERVAEDLRSIPVLKPNEAMFEEALAYGDRIGMLATFQPSIPPMTQEFANMAEIRGSDATLECVWVEGAMDALRHGDVEAHNQLIAREASNLSECDAVMLAHFSTAQAYSGVSAVLECPILSSPGSAVRKLKSAFGCKK